LNALFFCSWRNNFIPWLHSKKVISKLHLENIKSSLIACIPAMFCFHKKLRYHAQELKKVWGRHFSISTVALVMCSRYKKSGNSKTLRVRQRCENVKIARPLCATHTDQLERLPTTSTRIPPIHVSLERKITRRNFCLCRSRLCFINWFCTRELGEAMQ
jgi:hypothetical protein